MIDLATLRTNLEDVEARIARAAAKAQRTRDEITLVAVTKTYPAEVVALAYQLGLREMGENRVEEAREKQAGLPADIRWHLIGHLQSRKARHALGAFALIHSIDSVRLASELSKRVAGLGEQESVGREVGILLQVNVSGEESKSGFDATTPTALEAFVAHAATIAALPGLRVRGLMTMAPWADNPEETRPVWIATRHLQTTLQQMLPAYDWSLLSMGMTNDFEVAIEEGATHIRVGTALFGVRPPLQG